MYNIIYTLCYNCFLFIFIIKNIITKKQKKTLHLSFEKIKWSVSNVGEVGLEPTCNQLRFISFVALSGLEPEPTESQILAHFQNYAIRL